MHTRITQTSGARGFIIGGDFLCKKWLALAVAGKIIYNISTDKQAYQQFTLGLETTYVMNELVNRIFKAVIRPQHVARAAESHLQLVTLIQEYQKR